MLVCVDGNRKDGSCSKRTLGVTVDNLLYDNDSAPYGSYDKEFAELISDCTGQERRTILESAVQVKKALRKKV